MKRFAILCALLALAWIARTVAQNRPFVAGTPVTMAAGDINEDGALDLVTSSFEGDAVSVLMGR